MVYGYRGEAAPGFLFGLIQWRMGYSQINPRRLQLRFVVLGAGGLGNEGAWRREVEAYGIVEGKRNLVLRPYACSQRHAPDDPTHGVDFVTGTEFEGQA